MGRPDNLDQLKAAYEQQRDEYNVLFERIAAGQHVPPQQLNTAAELLLLAVKPYRAAEAAAYRASR